MNGRCIIFDKLIVYGTFGWAFGLFAEGVAPTSVGGEWSNLTALGAVIIVLIFIVTKMLPDLHQKFVEQSKVFAESTSAQSEAFSTALRDTLNKSSDILDKVHDRTSQATAATAEEMARLREHCAAQHGIDRMQQHPHQKSDPFGVTSHSTSPFHGENKNE
jgi:hypothetical protein